MENSTRRKSRTSGANPVTIRDVAKRVGVRPMTVSRVFNTTRRISDVTRAAVRDVRAGLSAPVLLSPGENSVTLAGYTVSFPKIKVTGVRPVTYDAAIPCGGFAARFRPAQTPGGNPVVTLEVENSIR